MRAVLLVLTTLLSAFLTATSFAQKLVRVEAINTPHPNFELCLGETLEPRATFRNMGNVPQRLRLQLTIRNEVTGINVYGDTAIVENAPAGISIACNFKSFVTNPNILSQLGRFRVTAIIEGTDGGGVYSDTMWSNLSGLRRTAQPFNDACNNYSVLNPFDSISVPDQHKWISHGATVVDGAGLTFDPLSPRYEDEDTLGMGPKKFKDPVVMLDRRNTQGVLYVGDDVGDTLLSFAVNLKGITRSSVYIGYHRSNKRQYSFAYDQDTLFGPEATIVSENGQVTRPGDSLLLEFRHPADSFCDDPDARWIPIRAVDGGKDFGFERIVVDLSPKDTLKPNYLNYFTQNFRFRLRLKANANRESSAIDDDDAWYLDNLSLQTPRLPEFGMSWVRAVSAYTKLPASQNVYEIYANIANNWAGVTYGDINVKITAPNGITKYFKTVRSENVRRDTIVRFPDWDATNARFIAGSKYEISTKLQEGFDSYEDDNEARSTFYLVTDFDLSKPQEFALDDGTNDWPEITKRQGAGVGFSNTSGSYAMRIRLVRPDTIFGARIYFASGNSAPDPIKIAIHRGNDTSDVPGEMIDGAMMQAERGGDAFDKFWTYRFTTPVVVPAGDYWLAVSQLGLDNMAIGADISRSGFDMTVSGDSPKYEFIHRSPYGTQYDTTKNSGDISRMIAFEVPAGSGNWKPFIPEYAMDPAQGFASTGTYIPMIRPLVGNGTAMAGVNSNEDERSIAAYPNPFSANNEVLTFKSSSGEQLRSAWIKNVLGQPVRILEAKSALQWDGKDNNGAVVSPGVYVVRFEDGRTLQVVAQ